MPKQWDSRSRDKDKEIGPAFKYACKLQSERLLDRCERSAMSHFELDDLHGKSLGVDNHSRVKEFIRTGQHWDSKQEKPKSQCAN